MPSPNVIIRAKLLDHAHRLGLHKANGCIYEPFPTPWTSTHRQCTAYRERCTYEDYINEVLAEVDVYTSNSTRFDDALKFLKTCTDPRLPPLHRDRSLISFANGILDMATASFFAPHAPCGSGPTPACLTCSAADMPDPALRTRTPPAQNHASCTLLNACALTHAACNVRAQP